MKRKLIPLKNRPSDYFMSTCPKCGKVRYNIRLNSGCGIGKTEYLCGDGYNKDMSIRGCDGLYVHIINPKYI